MAAAYRNAWKQRKPHHEADFSGRKKIRPKIDRLRWLSPRSELKPVPSATKKVSANFPKKGFNKCTGKDCGKTRGKKLIVPPSLPLPPNPLTPALRHPLHCRFIWHAAAAVVVVVVAVVLKHGKWFPGSIGTAITADFRCSPAFDFFCGAEKLPRHPRTSKQLTRVILKHPFFVISAFLIVKERIKLPRN